MNFPLVLGDTALDDDHALLQQLILHLQDAPPALAASALEAVRAHAQKHFAMEDLDIQVMKDGNAKCHLDEHSAVLKSLDEVGAVLVQNDVTGAAKALLVRRLTTQLLSWLPEHVNAMDSGVASHRSGQRFGGAPVKIARRPAG